MSNDEAFRHIAYRTIKRLAGANMNGVRCFQHDLVVFAGHNGQLCLPCSFKAQI
jgi:hypothetical protein